MNESTTTETSPSPERPRRRPWLGVAVAAAALLVATPVAAHSGAFGPARGPGGPAGAAAFGSRSGTGFGPGMHAGATAGVRGGAFGGVHADALTPLGALGPMAPMALQRLPLGTDVTVQVYDADPAQGAEPTVTLTAIVGQTSEVAFAEQVRSATADAAFVTVATGPRTERVALGDDADRRRAQAARLLRPFALELGQTVEVAFFASEDDAAASATASFTYGRDSAAAFRQRIADAASEAAIAEITLPAQERTVDLSATPWNGARDAEAARGDGVRRGYGPGMEGQARPAHPMRPGGFGPRGAPTDPPTGLPSDPPSD